MDRRKFIGLTGLLASIWIPMVGKAASSQTNIHVAASPIDSCGTTGSASIVANTKIKVVGVGGAGSNAVEHMIGEGASSIEFICVNSDSKALNFSSAKRKILIDDGLGKAGSASAAMLMATRHLREITEALKGAHIVFIIAGLGGAAGTGASPVIANIARSQGALTVAVITTPFSFEGRRKRVAADGLANLEQCVDSVIVVPNETLIENLDDEISMLDAFRFSDNVLMNAVCNITNSIVLPSLVGLDLEDVRFAMSGMCRATTGYAICVRRFTGVMREGQNSAQCTCYGRSYSGHCCPGLQVCD